MEGMRSVLDVMSTAHVSKLQGVNVSSLIRCAIQLLLKNMTHGDDPIERQQCQESCTMIGNILDQGLKIFEKLGVQGVAANDVTWIVSKAYNSALHQSQDENVEGSLALSNMALQVRNELPI